jgi:hypothetical protein
MVAYSDSHLDELRLCPSSLEAQLPSEGAVAHATGNRYKVPFTLDKRGYQA